MHQIRFSNVFLCVSLGLLAVGCNSGGSSSSDNGGGDTDLDGGGGGGGGDGSDGGGSTESLDLIDLDGDPDGDGIVDMPDSVDSVFRDVFGRYAAVETSAGRIHLLAQAGVPTEKIRRSREILRQHLQPVVGSAQGENKDDVAAAMVNRGASLSIFESGSAIDLSNPDIVAFFQYSADSTIPIAATRIVIEGSSPYTATLPAEDNTFGATAALVYRMGLVPVRSTYANQLKDLAADRMVSSVFTPRAGTPTGDTDEAFLAMAMDVHSGVFGHDPSGDGTSTGTTGTYGSISREDMAARDPETLAWIEDFYSTDHSFEAVLPTSFSGNFDCLRRTAKPYTARSQHLRNMQLTGTNTAELFAAPFDSILRGNDANNNFKGRRGYDTIYGGGGFDTAVFNGPRADYTVEILSDRVIVEDVLGGHEQTDTLYGIERLQFADGGENL